MHAFLQRFGGLVLGILSGFDRLDQIARQFAARRGVQEGLVCVLQCVEPCWSFDLRSLNQRLAVRGQERRCSHLYHYYLHPQFGWKSDESCRRTEGHRERKVRALNPLASEDGALLELIADPRWLIAGVRNRDLVTALKGSDKT